MDAAIYILTGLLAFGWAIAATFLLIRLIFPATPPRPARPKATDEQRRTAPTLPYVRIAQLLTPAERSFFEVLRAATPSGLVVFPQVRVANLIQTTGHGKQRAYNFYRIQAKCVDFVLCDAATTAPCLVVELDDSSHDRPDRRARDAFVDAALADAGIPVLHVRWQRQYDGLALATQINAALNNAPAHESANVQRPSQWEDRHQNLPLPQHWHQPDVTLNGQNLVPGVRDAPVQGSSSSVSITQPTFIGAAAQPMVCVCGQCQREIRPDAKFCQHCGATLAFGSGAT